VLGQLGAHGEMVDWLAPLGEREHRGVDEFVLLAVEVFWPQALLEHDRL
jgi:hypothetical protein